MKRREKKQRLILAYDVRDADFSSSSSIDKSLDHVKKCRGGSEKDSESPLFPYGKRVAV